MIKSTNVRILWILIAIFAMHAIFACEDDNGTVADLFGDPAGANHVTGTIIVRTTDQPSGTIKQYLLAREIGAKILLDFEYDPNLKTGETVKVGGDWQGENAFFVKGFERLTRQMMRTNGPLVRKKTQHRVAVLAVQEANITEAKALQDIKGAQDSVDNFYAENSFGIDSFSAEVFKRYSISYTANDCLYDNSDNMADKLIAKFESDGYKAFDYDHVVVVVPNSCGSDWSGAWAYIGGITDNGTTRFSLISMYKDNAYDPWFLSHELGHNLGMNHARSMSCGSAYYNPKAQGCNFDEYGNHNDVMGNGEGVYFSVPYQRYLGWIGATNVATAGKSGTFNLQPADGEMCGIRGVRIPIPGESGNYFYVEYRRARSDSRYAGTARFGRERQDSVLITRSADGQGGNDSSYTDRVEVGTDKYTGVKQNVRYDLSGGVAVKVIAMGADFAQVSIEMPGSANHLDDSGAKVAVESDGTNGIKTCSSSTDDCPNDPNKTNPGICGCGVADVDSDGDGTADCQDNCPTDINKTQPGECGCGTVEGSCNGGEGNGLRGTYFNNMDLTDQVLARVDPIVNFNWGNGSPDSKIDSDSFSARWTGFVEAKHTEKHTFYTVTDDGVRLWINGQRIINNWTNHGPTEDSGTISLEAGKRYSIQLEYYENSGGAVAKLLWSSASQTKQVIPMGQLFAEAGDDEPDLCPNDPNKTEPGECGCGVPEGTCGASSYYCGEANEHKSTTINCPDGETIVSVDFASYGTPEGTCASGFVESTCHADNSMSIVEDACLGQQSCTLSASNGVFGDPCSGAFKRLRIKVTCSSGTQDAQEGLMGEYFNNMDLTDSVLKRVDPTVNFNWGSGAPDSQIDANTFSVRWTGFVEALHSETYTFYTVSDDGVRLWIDGQLIIDNWTNHAPTENRGNIALEAGQSYSIKLEYYENGGGAVAQLLWSSASLAKQVIPAEQLFTDATGEDPDMCPNDPNKIEPGECGCGVPEGTCGPLLYEAEDNTARSGCNVATNHSGFTGTGFMDYGGNGTWIEWDNIRVAKGGFYRLVFRYAAGTQRQSAAIVNGLDAGNVAFESTGGWTIWNTEAITVPLRAGNNTIRIMANTSRGGPNLDSLLIIAI